MNYQVNLVNIEYDLTGDNGGRFLDDATLIVSATNVPYRAINANFGVKSCYYKKVTCKANS